MLSVIHIIIVHAYYYHSYSYYKYILIATACCASFVAKY